MKGKVLFVVGLGIGYVLGTRAGRERYEQIRKAAENVWNMPAVQQGVGTVTDFAKTRVGDLSDTVLDGVKNLIGNATKTSGATKQDVSRAARTAKQNISKAADAAKSAVDDAASKLDDAIDDAADVASKSAATSKSSSSKSSTSKPSAKSSSSTSGGSSATSGS
jgi:phage-related protein